MADSVSGPSRARVGVEGIEMPLKTVIIVLTAIVTTRVKPSLLSITTFSFSSWKNSSTTRKIAMVVQKLERRKTGEAKGQELLNRGLVVPNETEA